jgi:hypothetical protein
LAGHQTTGRVEGGVVTVVTGGAWGRHLRSRAIEDEDACKFCTSAPFVERRQGQTRTGFYLVDLLIQH